MTTIKPTNLREVMNDGFTLAYDEFMSGGQGRKQFREAINKYILQPSEVDVDERLIKILWEKIDRESEGTWRYEVFKDNIKHLSTSKVKEEEKLKYHKIKCPQCGMKLKHFYYG